MFLSEAHSLGIGTVFYSKGTHFSLFPMTDLLEVGYVIISKVIDCTRKALKLCKHRPKANCYMSYFENCEFFFLICK